MFRYEEYLHSKAAPTQDSSQPQISQFVRSSKQQYTSSHPQQNAITRSVLSDLVIDCNLPLSIIEHPSFRRFLSVVDTRYSPVSRRTLTSKLDGAVLEKQTKLELQAVMQGSKKCAFRRHNEKHVFKRNGHGVCQKMQLTPVNLWI